MYVNDFKYGDIEFEAGADQYLDENGFDSVDILFVKCNGKSYMEEFPLFTIINGRGNPVEKHIKDEAVKLLREKQPLLFLL